MVAVRAVSGRVRKEQMAATPYFRRSHQMAAVAVAHFKTSLLMQTEKMVVLAAALRMPELEALPHRDKETTAQATLEQMVALEVAEKVPLVPLGLEPLAGQEVAVLHLQ